MKKIIKNAIFKLIPEELFEFARFEYGSKLGRYFSRNLTISKDKKNYINLGSGNIYIKNMINVDFFSNKNKDYGLDLRYPFKIESECIDGIFSEHTFEHLAHSEIDNALSESFRILKKNSKIRIIVPDMSIFIKKYYENDKEWFKKWKETVLIGETRRHMHKYFTKIFALNFTSNFYYHQSSWDFEMAKDFLERNGFSNVTKCSFREGANELLHDSNSKDRKMVSLYIEALKE
jgi:predicted SAM-dependent methyltransferase